jgi:hypothetical protein
MSSPTSPGDSAARSRRQLVDRSDPVRVGGWLVGMAIAFALTLAIAGAANAASAITRTDLTGTAFANPCTAEPIIIVGGTLQSIVNSTSDGAGGLHVDIRGSAQDVVAKGGTSGDMYHLSGDFWSEQTVHDASYPVVLTVVEVHNAVSAGSAEDFIVHIVRHLTIDANGDVTASVETVSAECRG